MTTIGVDAFSGNAWDTLCEPLANQPGEAWEYGVSIDWGGELVSRATGMSLNDYFLKHILGPMALKNINLFPSKHMKENLAYMHFRDPAGKLQLRPHGHPSKRALWVKIEAEIRGTYNAGGAGFFAKPAKYCQIIAMLLNNGVHPRTGAKILEKTVDEMFTNQIPICPTSVDSLFTHPNLIFPMWLPSYIHNRMISHRVGA